MSVCVVNLNKKNCKSQYKKNGSNDIENAMEICINLPYKHRCNISKYQMMNSISLETISFIETCT